MCAMFVSPDSILFVTNEEVLREEVNDKGCILENVGWRKTDGLWGHWTHLCHG